MKTTCNTVSALSTIFLACLCATAAAQSGFDPSPDPGSHPQANPTIGTVSPVHAMPDQAMQQPAQFLVGRWRTSGNLPFGDGNTANGELHMTFGQDGNFVMNGQYQAPTPQAGEVPVSVTLSGQWRLGPQSTPTALAVTLSGNLTMTLPPEYNMPPESQQMSDDDILQIVDANTLRDSNGLTWSRF